LVIITVIIVAVAFCCLLIIIIFYPRQSLFSAHTHTTHNNRLTISVIVGTTDKDRCTFFQKPGWNGIGIKLLVWAV